MMGSGSGRGTSAVCRGSWRSRSGDKHFLPLNNVYIGKLSEDLPLRFLCYESNCYRAWRYCAPCCRPSATPPPDLLPLHPGASGDACLEIISPWVDIQPETSSSVSRGAVWSSAKLLSADPRRVFQRIKTTVCVGLVHI